MRLMNQKKEADEKESQQNKGAQNKDGVETDVNNDSDDEVLATQDKVDNTDRPIGKRCVENQSPVIADSDLRDRKKARVVAVVAVSVEHCYYIHVITYYIPSNVVIEKNTKP